MKYYNWEDVPEGVVVADNDGGLVWIKQLNGTAVANCTDNQSASGWVNFGLRGPASDSYPLEAVHG
jgi:hypothetical protein